MAKTPDERLTPSLVAFIHIGREKLSGEDMDQKVEMIRSRLAANIPVILDNISSTTDMGFDEAAAELVRGDVHGEVEVIGMSIIVFMLN
jgi:hypothetical protein